MQARWILTFVSIAVAHFAATAALHYSAFSQCREAVGAGCGLITAAAGALSFPLLPIATLFTSGSMGWRAGLVVFAANSIGFGIVLTGAIWWLARRRSRAD